MVKAKLTSPDTSPDAPLEVDVLVVGGGLVGATLAIALAGAGITVALVDRENPAAVLRAQFDGRCSAIAQASQQVLRGLGVWENIASEAAPIEQIRVSDGGSLFFLHYDCAEIGDDPLGFMVENRVMRKALQLRLEDESGVAYFAPDGIDTLARTPGLVRARLESGREIQARLVAGCEGRRSPTREAAGIALTRWSYRQTAIVCTVEHERSHNFIAHEHFLPAGPFAILPLLGTKEKPGRRSSLVWTERADIAPAMMALNDADFLAELSKRFGDFLGELRVVGPRFSYPLSLQYAQRSVDRRLVLVGDASHGMHPIAGQGLNMGLRDVAVLSELLVDAARLGLDLGDAALLERYERARRFDNHVMLAMTDVLNRLFSNDFTPLRLARDLGLGAVNKMPGVKKFFMRDAMGQLGALPRLMRGEKL
ncbi:2-octaprenyl-6-methoxyphenyl hydroxylase [Varunaivibrio sulfuroxidans]|uniref:2-octaprenyl-6-methoxyphenol hydroxylase /2-octaprenyl-3-methyl-6-methoxy-1,4-benzoquinol hydroxylase n=1 Tax=Varunaivibrio sulfuroxidans TaxID=1773489 RepID=A0A4R3JG02_9PROT|nr:2-octaprenyl-6-methoxyphenyl hydroxylase [Varunaivibrio sulfuroxidans]TCS64834.1 2-octaprenyl-6-methoxyphenol hydroxylase /2-octaprenyl-3-methyl-6-methoxy-1,4-benzoquinol hydroxylase [Varunaivibrio sulfuroxidans]WES29865.1 2-octaprenyl-6-methoxyphenyl hydroxylase [Varunaivibrio sulfuroxidans]